MASATALKMYGAGGNPNGSIALPQPDAQEKSLVRMDRNVTIRSFNIKFGHQCSYPKPNQMTTRIIDRDIMERKDMLQNPRVDTRELKQ